MGVKKADDSSELFYTSIRLPLDLVSRIDALANKLDISRNRMILNLLTVALDDAELLRKLGLLKLSQVLNAFNLSDDDFKKVKNET